MVWTVNAQFVGLLALSDSKLIKMINKWLINQVIGLFGELV